jgi:hypothetical protein
MKGSTEMRLTVTSSLNEISTDQPGNSVAVRREALLCPPPSLATAEPEFVNVSGAHESISGLLKRFTNTGSGFWTDI